MWTNSIDTPYNGYKFRSRLEARWAVFFDHANIRYYYEPEAFRLSSGKIYLPDFYLPDVYPRSTVSEPGIWVEVKPVYSPSEYEYLSEFAMMIKRRVALLVGEPRIVKEIYTKSYFVDYEAYEYSYGFDISMAFHKCPKCCRVAYDYQNYNKCRYCLERGEQVCLDPCHPDLARASEIARSWRFDEVIANRRNKHGKK